MHKVPNVVVGVDVSKAHLDVCIEPIGKTLKVVNSKHGIGGLIKVLSGYKVKRVVFESTGGYEDLLKTMLSKASYQAWCVDPKRINYFIRSSGKKAKTDKIDAKMIAKFALKNKNDYQPFEVSSEVLELRSYVHRRVDIATITSSEKKRFNHPKEDHAKTLIQEHIDFLRYQVKKIDKKIEFLIEENQKLKFDHDILISVPGVGKATAAVLLAFVPELGQLNSKQISALVGVVPYTNTSGDHQGKEFIQEGRFIPRKALYMAALSAIKTKSVFKETYLRLTEKGKPSKVALVAVMRKMIIILNAMVKNKRVWESNF